LVVAVWGAGGGRLLLTGRAKTKIKIKIKNKYRTKTKTKRRQDKTNLLVRTGRQGA
jgi:hypothetical protein